MRCEAGRQGDRNIGREKWREETGTNREEL
jgi:hypothetical protein